MSRRRYFEEQRSGNEAIYHCVEIDTDHDTYFEVLDLMSKMNPIQLAQIRLIIY